MKRISSRKKNKKKDGFSKAGRKTTDGVTKGVVLGTKLKLYGSAFKSL